MAATIGLLVGITLYFLLARTAHSEANPGQLYDTIPLDSNLSHIQIVQEAYIQPYTSPNYQTPGVVDIKRLIQPTKEVIYLPGFDDDVRWRGMCVGYVKHHLVKLAPELSGNAIDWKAYINQQEPIIGSVAVLQIGRWGHIGFVIDKTDETITIRSRNYQGLWIISDDVLSINDSSILGYITF